MTKRLKLPAQDEIINDYQWEKLLETKALIVVEVHAGWCGPCTSMKPTIRRIKQQVGDDANFAVANSDDISHLAPFRDKSEPTWLFLSEGEIVNVMHGCKSKELVDLISAELKKEILIQRGEIERESLELGDVQKDESPLVKPPPALPEKAAEKEVLALPFDEELRYRPFSVSYE
ncbi:hypothetical protein PPYR_08850 [Photinus pyralis]|uniref:Thioredoxin domain-containing protein n=2 Tax=Photinus pyralis TaxID=7054 RepID=A0A5N4AKL5_PHOPY|nr:thioredoxin domain-containing protein 3-like [Photinus pyralis]KAB0797857.1 hypothetical protein PPYR_08850 [Photinus pyralis]